MQVQPISNLQISTPSDTVAITTISGRCLGAAVTDGVDPTKQGCLIYDFYSYLRRFFYCFQDFFGLAKCDSPVCCFLTQEQRFRLFIHPKQPAQAVNLFDAGGFVFHIFVYVIGVQLSRLFLDATVFLHCLGITSQVIPEGQVAVKLL